MLRKILYIALFSLIFSQEYNMEMVSFISFGQDVSETQSDHIFPHLCNELTE